VANALVLLVFLTSVGTAACDLGAAADRGSAPASAALAVVIAEMPDAVRLHIQASGDVEAGSVEVRFSGRKMVVLARDAEGRPIRSQSLRLPEPVVEEGSSAEYDALDHANTGVVLPANGVVGRLDGMFSFRRFRSQQLLSVSTPAPRVWIGSPR
jgi:hypothetical protein